VLVDVSDLYAKYITGCAVTREQPLKCQAHPVYREQTASVLKTLTPREEKPLYRRADRVRVAASGDGNTDGGGDPEDGHLHADILSLEETVRGVKAHS